MRTARIEVVLLISRLICYQKGAVSYTTYVLLVIHKHVGPQRLDNQRRGSRRRIDAEPSDANERPLLERILLMEPTEQIMNVTIRLMDGRGIRPLRSVPC